MYTPNLVSCVALGCSALVLAQTPAGFTPGSTTRLGVAFPEFNITVTPGLAVPRPQTIDAPAIMPPTGINASKLIVFMIDSDVPQNSTRVTLLHWFAPDMTIASTGILVPSSTNATGVVGAPYLQPSPPVGDIPHRYTQILFAQPASFAIPSAFASINPPADDTDRIGFSLASFVAATGLEAPLAGNYFTVQNLTGVATGSVSGTGATPSATGTSFTGAASRVEGGGSGVFALAGGLMAVMWMICTQQDMAMNYSLVRGLPALTRRQHI